MRSLLVGGLPSLFAGLTVGKPFSTLRPYLSSSASQQWLFQARLSLGPAVNVTPARRSDTAEAKNRDRRALSPVVNKLCRRFWEFASFVAFGLLKEDLRQRHFGRRAQ